jgi:hypothetical protein
MSGDGSIESAIEEQVKREGDAVGSAKPPQKSDRQKRVEEILETIPKIGVREGYRQLSQVDPVIWCMFNRRLAGLPMTFDMSHLLTKQALRAKHKDFRDQKEFDRYIKRTQQRHRPWQMEPLRDDHPHKAYKKARQIGITELTYTEAVCFLDQHENTTLIYCFPRDKLLETFAATRIGPMFKETPRMAALLTGVNQVYLKAINKSHMIMRSAWEGGLGESVPADVVVFDEKDRMKPGVEVAFREALSSSVYAWLREVSTPTLPNRGVDAAWIKSDQREWFVKCTRCGHKQNMTHENLQQVHDLPMNCKEIPKGSYRIGCRRMRKGQPCGGELDRTVGEWVPRRPSVNLIRGYHMPQMIAVWLTAEAIMQKKLDYKFIQLWTNYVLGEVALAETMLLTDRDFDMAEARHPLIHRRSSKWPLISVGIDWGHKNWVVVEGLNANGRQYILNAKMFEDNRSRELEAVRDIDAWLEPYAPDIIVADDGYGKDRNAFLLRRATERNQGQFFACRYNNAEKGGVTFNPVWSDARNQVLCDRTSSLKNLCRRIKDREIGLPSFEYEVIQLLVSHLKAFTPMMEMDDEDDTKIVETINATGDDHLGHGTFYADLGMDHIRKTNQFNFSF